MSYLPRHTGLGGLSDIASAASAVVGDPCLSQVATLVLRLHAAQQPALPPLTPGGPRPAPPPPAKGIGLCSAVKPLQAVAWVSERPWVIPVGIVALFSGVFLAGYASGRTR